MKIPDFGTSFLNPQFNIFLLPVVPHNFPVANALFLLIKFVAQTLSALLYSSAISTVISVYHACIAEFHCSCYIICTVLYRAEKYTSFVFYSRPPVVARDSPQELENAPSRGVGVPWMVHFSIPPLRAQV